MYKQKPIKGLEDVSFDSNWTYQQYFGENQNV